MLVPIFVGIATPSGCGIIVVRGGCFGSEMLFPRRLIPVASRDVQERPLDRASNYVSNAMTT